MTAASSVATADVRLALSYCVVATSAPRRASVMTDRRTYCWLGGGADWELERGRVSQLPEMAQTCKEPMLLVSGPLHIAALVKIRMPKPHKRFRLIDRGLDLFVEHRSRDVSCKADLHTPRAEIGMHCFRPLT